MQGLRKSTLFVVLIIVFGAALAITTASAQDGSRVSANIPFDFSVENTTLKAGSYTVTELESGILVLRSDDGQVHQFAWTVRGNAPNPAQQPHLLFKRYGTEAFLNKVFLSSDTDCNELPRSSREKRLMKGQASGEELSGLIEPVR